MQALGIVLMHALGIVLIVAGVFFIFLSMVSATKKVFTRASQPASQDLGAFDPDAWAKLATALGNFVKVAPLWLLLALVGAGLVAWGTTMLN
jgi:ABC-type anion transport system duplicated permease subunit